MLILRHSHWPLFSISRFRLASQQIALLVVVLLTVVSVKAQTDSPRLVSVEAQALAVTLTALGDVFNVSVIAPSELVRDKQAPAIAGQLTLLDAFSSALDNTGLIARLSNSGSIVILNDDGRADTEQELAVEEILVIGTKQGLSLQDTQASVAVFTQRELNEQLLFNVGDVLLRTPNVASTSQGNGALNGLSIRGVTLGGVGEAGTGATAQIYLDGAPLSFNANQGAVNMWDIGQVEILRGPQSTVQGRNALAGAVVIQTSDPEYEFGARVQVLTGTEESEQYSAMVTGPIIADELAFRLAYDHREFDYGIFNVVSNQNAIFQETDTYRAKLLYEPSYLDGLRVELGTQYVETKFGEFNSVGGPGPVTDPEFSDFDPFGGISYLPGNRNELNKVTRYSLDVSYEINSQWNLVGLYTYEDVNRDTGFGELGFSNSDDETWSVELRSHFDYGRVRGWFGAYAFESDLPNRIVFDFSPFLGPTDPPNSQILLGNTSDEQTDNWAVFGDLTIELSESWELNLGARYDNESFSTIRLSDSVIDPPECTIPAFGGLPCGAFLPGGGDDPLQEADFDAFLPRGALTYRVSDDVSLSFGVQRGYRAGGAYLRNNASEGIQETGTFDEEYLTNYEISFRSQWLDRRLTINANVFFSDWEDQQVNIPGPSGALLDSFVVNVGESEIMGLELFSSMAWTPSLDTFVTLGFLNTEFTDFPYAANTGTEFDNLAGNEFPNAPEFTASAGFSYEHRTGLYTSWTISYTGEAFSDVENLGTDTTDDFFLLNARAGYRADRFEVYVFATNLLDEEFLLENDRFAVDLDTGEVNAVGVPSYNISDPQIIGASLVFEL
ncbi:MAG: TonB-dependent receptor [Pseudomonadota bacterium]